MACESEPVHSVDSVVWYNVMVWHSDAKTMNPVGTVFLLVEANLLGPVVSYNRFILWLFTFLTENERLHYIYMDVNI
jgi:hypothetical protein